MRPEPIAPPGFMPQRPPLSPAMKLGSLLFVSGLPGSDAEGRLAPDFAGQMRQTIANLATVLAAGGSGFDRVAKMNVYLTREQDLAEMNQLYATLFTPGREPARTTVVVKALPHPRFLLEIECVAACD